MANQYFTCVLDAWRDGRTLYGRMHYYRNGSYYYQDSSFPNPTMNLGGTVFTDTDFGNRVRSGIYVGDVYSTTFSRTVAGGGDRTVTWSAGSGVRSDFAGSWSATVWFPDPTSPPSGLSVSVAEVYTTGAKFNVSLSSYGNPSSADGRWIEAGFAGQNSWEGSLRSAIAKNTTSAQIVVDNNSTQTSSLTIRPNTQYYYGGYAYNTQLSTSTISGQLVTKALAPTLSVSSVTDKTATITYTTQADGGKYGKNIQYSLNNGTTWVTGATVNTGSATTGSFIIPNLTENTHYNVKTRVSTSAGTTNGNDFSFTTKVSTKFYGSANGRTELVEKLYGSVNGQTKEIIKMYGPAPISERLASFDYQQGPKEGNIAITSFSPDVLASTLRNDTTLLNFMATQDLNFENLYAMGIGMSPGDWQFAVYFMPEDGQGEEDLIYYYVSEYDSQYGGVPYTLEQLGLTIDESEAEVDDYEIYYLTPILQKTFASKLIYQKQND